jgi:hypothetical protein
MHKLDQPSITLALVEHYDYIALRRLLGPLLEPLLTHPSWSWYLHMLIGLGPLRQASAIGADLISGITTISMLKAYRLLRVGTVPGAAAPK